MAASPSSSSSSSAPPSVLSVSATAGATAVTASAATPALPPGALRKLDKYREQLERLEAGSWNELVVDPFEEGGDEDADGSRGCHAVYVFGLGAATGLPPSEATRVVEGVLSHGAPASSSSSSSPSPSSYTIERHAKLSYCLVHGLTRAQCRRLRAALHGQRRVDGCVGASDDSATSSDAVKQRADAARGGWLFVERARGQTGPPCQPSSSSSSSAAAAATVPVYGLRLNREQSCVRWQRSRPWPDLLLDAGAAKQEGADTDVAMPARARVVLNCCGVPGLFVIYDFLTEDEASALRPHVTPPRSLASPTAASPSLSSSSSSPSSLSSSSATSSSPSSPAAAEPQLSAWQRIRHRTVRHFGYKFDYRVNRCTRVVVDEAEAHKSIGAAAEPVSALPAWLQPLRRRVERALVSVIASQLVRGGDKSGGDVEGAGDGAAGDEDCRLLLDELHMHQQTKQPPNEAVGGGAHGVGGGSEASGSAKLPYFDQATVNVYERGGGIPLHVDTHAAFGGAIASVSLNSGVCMQFVPLLTAGDDADVDATANDTRFGSAHHHQQQHQQQQQQDTDGVRLWLPARSLLVMTGAARYAWTHAIAARNSDVVDGLPVERGSGEQTRVSITLRRVVHPSSPRPRSRPSEPSASADSSGTAAAAASSESLPPCPCRFRRACQADRRSQRAKEDAAAAASVAVDADAVVTAADAEATADADADRPR